MLIACGVLMAASANLGSNRRLQVEKVTSKSKRLALYVYYDFIRAAKQMDTYTKLLIMVNT